MSTLEKNNNLNGTKNKGPNSNNKVTKELVDSMSEDSIFEKLVEEGEWEQLLKFIGAIYKKPENGAYARLASKLLSDGYINIGTTERSYKVLERASNEMAEQIRQQNIEADVIVGAQMGSVRISLAVAKALDIKESVYTEKKGEEALLSKNIKELAEKIMNGELKQGDSIMNYIDLEIGKEMDFKRHDIDLMGKKIILSEDVVTKGSTLEKMIKLIDMKGGEVVGITCVVNRTGKDTFAGIPLISCYQPEPFQLYYDENTPEENRGEHKKLPEGSNIEEKPKNNWDKLVKSMR